MGGFIPPQSQLLLTADIWQGRGALLANQGWPATQLGLGSSGSLLCVSLAC